MKKQQKPAPVKKSTKAPSSFLSRQSYIYASICAIAAFLLYANTINYDYVLDDEAVITKNEFVQQGVSGIPAILSTDMWHFQNFTFGYYRPLSLITFAIEHQIAPNNPHLSHFINILLYALSCFVLCLLLLKIFRGINPIYSIMACLLFAAHPLHTEVVANIKSRDEILALLNMLLSILFIIKAWGTGKNTIRAYILPCLFFYLALISKETAQMEIVLIPIIYLFMAAGSVRQIAISIAPLIGVMVIFQIQKYLLLGTLLGTHDHDLISFPYINTGLEFPTMFYMFYYGVRLMLLPYPLTYNYGYNQIPAAPFSDPLVIVSILAFVGLVVSGWWYLRAKSPVGLGIGICLIMFLPGMLFTLLKGGIFAERLLYIPVIGLSIIIAWLLMKLSSTQPDPKTNPTELIKNWKLAIPFTVIFLAYSAGTVSRNMAWKDNMTLFSNDVHVSTNSCQAHYHYGSKMIDTGIENKNLAERAAYFEKGIKEMREAIRINPRYGEAYFDIGYAYHAIQYNFDSALYYYRIAMNETPGLVQTYNNLGMLYANVGKHYIASYYFNRAVQANPYFTEGVKNHERHVRETGFDTKVLPDSLLHN